MVDNATLVNCGDYRARRQPLVRHFCHSARALPVATEVLGGTTPGGEGRRAGDSDASPRDPMTRARRSNRTRWFGPRPLSVLRHHQRQDLEVAAADPARRVGVAMQTSARTPENSGTRTARRSADTCSPAGSNLRVRAARFAMLHACKAERSKARSQDWLRSKSGGRQALASAEYSGSFTALQARQSSPSLARS
jgi:hypothetical protein